MQPETSAAATMKLVGGDPCLDFVNTVGGRSAGTPARVRDDKLAAYPDLVAFGVHAGLVTPAAARDLLRRARARPREAFRALCRARALREALYRALLALRAGTPLAAADLAVINSEVGAARRAERLVARGSTLQATWPASGSRLDSPLWPVARSAAELLVSPELARLSQCGGESCSWLFLDRSRNRSRQWCTMQDCGNLAKVRRFRERHGPAASSR
jgi:predicted RNA-binding Zn ribbon-like protein